LVTDNQLVAAGQALIEIDPRDYAARLDQARAQRATAESQRVQAEAQLLVQRANADQADANIRVAEADLINAEHDLARYRSADPRAVSRQQLDSALAAERTDRARLDANRQAAEAARAQIEAAKAQIANAEAQIAQAKAQIAQAELQLSYTRLFAPVAGRIATRTVEVGNYVNPGDQLMAITEPNVWVTANYKETQLSHMRPGQPVDIEIDAYPSVTFHGRVDSIQSGTGSYFSALPAQNATGNYVKVVQRLPVKILIEDDRANQYLLSLGMSVEPTVAVR
jgi:membrane fusion protein (multidrug efflux system)